ncbi:glycosyltransferase family 2 protein [Agromyces atrinae]|uniref:Cellulose synthase/poly-beta-1,6-N-acetylglucosamine synthase-like glycosyltransferase n=1 Tax=Agromyces atrinae TaxID=592376 RepID=A0A4Q2MC40_9MICO|nr:glycosyltransferase family 2 protein [Agromyces atrinae]NYD66948.1 cellulose synthase/poly-beta-1,6-N-acetylglucosamine synthase-like glycosyltransferase [Agromyces atrinae]RXZ87592.1 glycosyltransferase family 2 protein [Agromyces atrinae]
MSENARQQNETASRGAAGNPYVRRAQLPGSDLAAEANEFISSVEALPTYRSTIGCIVPAYNEEESIGEVLESLVNQTRLPDVIHVIVNNTSDRTVEIAAEYAGVHTRETDGVEQFTEVFVHDIGKNPDKKVGALNYGFTLIDGLDYMLGVDGDTVADSRAIEFLEAEISSDTRIGGISAIYSIDDRPFSGIVAPFLIAGQRAQFAAFNMQNMLRGRNMAVLGGQYSIFAIKALRDAMRENHQSTPWVKDSEVEDSLLSLQIKSAGYLTKISARARADVGGMTTVRGLDAQQVKWNYGAIELMWPGQRGDTKGQPFHPNLRLRWWENFSMLLNAVTRVLFMVFLAASLSISAFVFSPLWLIPPFVAILLNLRIALSMKNRTAKDVLFAVLLFPAEIYMWIRIGHFFRAWSKFFSRKQVDNWAEQAKAERGSGNAHLAPILFAVAFIAALVALWLILPVMVQSTILWIGWPVVGAITILQTLTMFGSLVRRHHGYKV